MSAQSAAMITVVFVVERSSHGPSAARRRAQKACARKSGVAPGPFGSRLRVNEMTIFDACAQIRRERRGLTANGHFDFDGGVAVGRFGDDESAGYGLETGFCGFEGVDAAGDLGDFELAGGDSGS
jgi:hypothetical protein